MLERITSPPLPAFPALHGSHLRLIDVINASPVPIVNFGGNIHCATLSPPRYEKYVLPACLERCDKLHRAGKLISAHGDGDTRALLPSATRSITRTASPR